MTSHTEHYASTSPSLSAVARSMMDFMSGLARAQRRRKAVRALRELDDHILSDIGIGRSEIVFAVSRPRER